MAKVRLLVPMAGEKSWNVGDEFECSAAEAGRLIKGKVAERLKATSPGSDAAGADAGTEPEGEPGGDDNAADPADPAEGADADVGEAPTDGAQDG